MRIYISGPMTGRPDLNRKAFFDAEEKLHHAGNFVINPFYISEDFGTAAELAESFGEYYRLLDQSGPGYNPADEIKERTRIARAVMDADLTAVRSCDAIFLLRGWEHSRGAKKELAEALKHGLKVMLEGEENWRTR